jgi:hypothetical protein
MKNTIIPLIMNDILLYKNIYRYYNHDFLSIFFLQTRPPQGNDPSSATDPILNPSPNHQLKAHPAKTGKQ